MKRTMYEAARHTPKDEAGGSNPFKRAIGLGLDAIRAPGPAFYFAVSPAFVAGIFCCCVYSRYFADNATCFHKG